MPEGRLSSDAMRTVAVPSRRLYETRRNKAFGPCGQEHGIGSQTEAGDPATPSSPACMKQTAWDVDKDGTGWRDGYN
jgi:hypothetical protein